MSTAPDAPEVQDATLPGRATRAAAPGSALRRLMLGIRERPAQAVGSALMIALLAGVLAALTLVLQQAVDQGEMRRSAQAELNRAMWQCRALPRADARADCLAALLPIPRDNAALPRNRPAAP